MKSMTGFGYAELRKDDYLCKIKLNSVNQKYSDINIKIPLDLLILESEIKKIIQTHITRGRTSIFIELEKEKKLETYKIDTDIIKYYYDLIKEINNKFDLMPDTIRALDLLKLKDVIKYEKTGIEIEPAWILIKDTLTQALNMFEEMRIKEGNKLKEDISYRINILNEINNEIQKLKEENKIIYETKLNKRLKELLPDTLINDEIIKLEFAILIDRSDVTEELVRIKSHLDQFNQVINNENNKSIGRQLDFICQELNREFNTIGSKANFYNISDNVIRAKCELEKIREQIQNLE